MRLCEYRPTHERTSRDGLDKSALLELTEALSSADGGQLMRRLLHTILQGLIDAEAAQHIGADPHERTESRTTLRNGTRDKTVSTTAGVSSWLSASGWSKVSTGWSVTGRGWWWPTGSWIICGAGRSPQPRSARTPSTSPNFARFLQEKRLDLIGVAPNDVFAWVDWQGVAKLHTGSRVVRLAPRTAAPATVNRRVAAVRGFFEFAVIRGTGAANPVPAPRRGQGLRPTTRGIFGHLGSGRARGGGWSVSSAASLSPLPCRRPSVTAQLGHRPGSGVSEKRCNWPNGWATAQRKGSA